MENTKNPIYLKIHIGNNQDIKKITELTLRHRTLIDELYENIEAIKHCYLEPTIEIGEANDTTIPIASGHIKIKPEI